MGFRQYGYWLRQAEAVRRRNIANMAHAVSIGMADEKGHQKAMDELELVRTAEESKAMLQNSFWSLSTFFGKIKGRRGRKEGMGV